MLGSLIDCHQDLHSSLPCRKGRILRDIIDAELTIFKLMHSISDSLGYGVTKNIKVNNSFSITSNRDNPGPQGAFWKFPNERKRRSILHEDDNRILWESGVNVDLTFYSSVKTSFVTNPQFLSLNSTFHQYFKDNGLDFDMMYHHSQHAGIYTNMLREVMNEVVSLIEEAFQDRVDHYYTREHFFLPDPSLSEMNYFHLVVKGYLSIVRTAVQQHERLRRDCLNRRFPLSHLSQTLLEEDLAMISAKLRNRGVPYNLAIPAKLFLPYLTSPLVSCTEDPENSVTKIILSIPIQPYDYIYKVIKVTPLPFRDLNNTYIYKSIPQVVVSGVRRNRTAFTHVSDFMPLKFVYGLSPLEMLDCSDELCFLPNLHTFTYMEQQCLYHIVHGGSYTDFYACKIQLIPTQSQTVVRLTKNQIAIANPLPSLRVYCDTEALTLEKLLPHGLIIINLQCHCQLRQSAGQSQLRLDQGMIYPTEFPCVEYNSEPHVFSLFPIVMVNTTFIIPESRDLVSLPTITPPDSSISNLVNHPGLANPVTVEDPQSSGLNLTEVEEEEGIYESFILGPNNSNILPLTLIFLLSLVVCYLLFMQHKLFTLLLLPQPVSSHPQKVVCHFPLHIEIMLNIIGVLLIGCLIYKLVCKVVRPIQRLSRRLNQHSASSIPLCSGYAPASCTHSNNTEDSQSNTAFNLPLISESTSHALPSTSRWGNKYRYIPKPFTFPTDTPPQISPITFPEIAAKYTPRGESVTLLTRNASRDELSPLHPITPLTLI